MSYAKVSYPSYCETNGLSIGYFFNDGVCDPRNDASCDASVNVVSVHLEALELQLLDIVKDEHKSAIVKWAEEYALQEHLRVMQRPE